MLSVQYLIHLSVVFVLTNIFGTHLFCNALFNAIRSQMRYLCLRPMINAFADKCMAGIQVYNAFLNVVIFCTQMDFDQALKINAFVFLTLYGIILKKNV